MRKTSVALADGRELRSAVTIWTAGFGVPDLAARSGLATDAIGRLLTDETLTSVDNPYIVAAGDASAPSDSPLRMSCQAAIPLGAQAANTVLSRIAGTEPAAVNQAFTGQCISLGRKAGTIQLAHLDDRVMPIYVGGRTAAIHQGGRLQGHGLVPGQGGPQAGLVLLAQGRQACAAPGGGRAGGAKCDERPTNTRSGSPLLRPLLFTIAYEILGTATESDDVLQESYLRWAEVDLASVQDTKAYLAKLVTRQALNALRAQARRREEYVGPWLPEPLLVDAGDASSDVVLAESVSMAMLVVLETLSPDERAVFVLREVFGFSHDEIASAIGKSSASVRQLAHRAREHVQARRKRFDPVDPQAVDGAHRAVLRHRRDGRHRRADRDAGAGRGVDRGQRRQGQRGAQAGTRSGSGRPPGPRTHPARGRARAASSRRSTTARPRWCSTWATTWRASSRWSSPTGRSATSTRCATRRSSAGSRSRRELTRLA